ncbi:MAG: hypothetical protein ACRC6N_04750 [Plesiomonas sp.]|uniref:hypothetical protein n=1 Tax=Plesiomonas sp. TaxID=2486279 RepID=UPI003F36CBFC
MKINSVILMLSILIQCSHVLATEQTCTPTEINSVAHIKEKILSQACKTLPNDDSMTIISIIYDTGRTDGELPIYHWTVALKNSKKRIAQSSYTEEIVVDSAINVYSSSIWIDTANYILVDGLRAFGIRLDIEDGPSCADFHQGNKLTLFIHKDDKITPVLKHLPMQFTHYITPSACGNNSNKAEEITERAISSIAILKSKQHGLHDIKITTKSALIKSKKDSKDEIIGTRVFTKTIGFNGVEYTIGNIDENPSKEWWIHKK